MAYDPGYGIATVRHRIDGLEKNLGGIQIYNLVRHRIDGLEITFRVINFIAVVRHRIDGLESRRISGIL